MLTCFFCSRSMLIIAILETTWTLMQNKLFPIFHMNLISGTGNYYVTIFFTKANGYFLIIINCFNSIAN